MRRRIAGWNRHELENAAIGGRPAGMSRISVIAVLMTVMRVGDSPVRINSVQAGGVAGLHRVVAVLFTARAMGDACPRCLHGQHGQQEHDDQSFHGGRL